MKRGKERIALRGTLIATFGLLVCVAACSDQATKQETSATIAERVSPAPSTDIVLDVSYPAGFSINTTAIGASNDLTLGASTQILDPSGSPGNVTNAGSGASNIGASSAAGTFAALGNLTLGSGVTAKTAEAGGAIAVGANAHVVSVQPHASLTPLTHRSITVHPPTGTAVDVTVAANGAATIAPGLYRNITVGANATVNLSTGSYVADNITLGAGSIAHLDTTNGSVQAFANSSIAWFGKTVGDGSRFVLGALGSGSLTLAGGGFQGTAVAPNGTLTIGSASTPYSGTFYGKHVTVGSGVKIHELSTPFLLNSLSVAKTTMCVGEQTEVSLGTLPPSKDVTYRIQGVVGDHQFLQFGNAPGSRLVYASARATDGRADFLSVPVTIQDCNGAPNAPYRALHFWGALGKPNAVQLMVKNYDAARHETSVEPGATFTWDFGDGQTSTTSTALVTHDYSNAINPLSTYNFFPVTVQVNGPAGASTIKKVVPIWNLYAKNRSKGIIRPPAQLATAGGNNYGVAITNYESTPLTISSARVDLIPCDPSLDVRPRPADTLSQTVPPNGSATVSITAPVVPQDVCTIGVHLMGSSAVGAVYSDAYVPIKENHLLARSVTNPDTVALLNQASSMTSDPNHFTEEELTQLVADGKLAKLPPAIPNGTTYDSPGDECYPGDTPSVPGLSCQPSADWVAIPATILNAFKGDVIMDHGCGVIGNLLTAVGENFSHDSIVTRNQVEVTHPS